MSNYLDVDIELLEVRVNAVQLVDDTDDSIEASVLFNQAGMDLVWNFTTTGGATTQTAVTPAASGDYAWINQGKGVYTLQIPATGGASINNNLAGHGQFSGEATGIRPWVGPIYTFRAAPLNNALIDGGDVLDVSVTELAGVTQSLADLKDFADEGYDPSANKVNGVVLVDTTTDVTNQVAAASGTLFKTLDAVTTTTVGTEAGTVANIAAVDGIIHSYEDLAGTTEFYYTKTLSVNEVASEFLWDGYVQSNGDTCTVQGYDWVQASFVTIGSITGSNGTLIAERTFPLTFDMTGTGADAGKVRMQFTSTTATLVATDRAWVGFASIAAEATILNSGIAQGGSANTIQLATSASAILNFYENTRIVTTGGTGADQERVAVGSATDRTVTISPVWSTNPDNTTTYSVFPASGHMTTAGGTYSGESVHIGASGSITAITGVDGIDTNPIDDGQLTNARTVADDKGFSKYTVDSGSSIVLNAAHDNWVFDGEGYALDLGSQSISNTRISMAQGVTGTATGAVSPFFSLTNFASPTLPPFGAFECSFSGTVTLGSAGNTTIGSSGGIAGAGPIFVLPSSASASNLAFYDWRNGMTVKNMGQGGGAVTVVVTGSCRLTLDATDIGGTVDVYAPATVDKGASSGITFNFYNHWGDLTTDNAETGSFGKSIADTKTDTTSILARIGAFTGTGVNTVIGFFQALLRKDASLPSDIGGTYAVATDSQQGIKDLGDANWTTATGFSTLIVSDILSSGTALDTTAGVLDVVATVNAATLADGVTHGGTTATLRLGSSTSTAAFYVTNSFLDAAAVRYEGTHTTGSQGLHLISKGNTRGAALVMNSGGSTSTPGSTFASWATGDLFTNGDISADTFTGTFTGNLTGSVGSVLGGINTTSGVITTLDGLNNLSAQQVIEYDTTNSDGTAPKNSIYTLIHAGLHADTSVANTLKINQTDDTTVHATFTLTVDANADHITKVES